MVKLLKYIDGEWRVVDYGLPRLAEVYLRMGYIVEYPDQKRRKEK